MRKQGDGRKGARGGAGQGRPTGGKSSAFPEGRGGVVPTKIAERMLAEQERKAERRAAEAPMAPKVSPVIRALKRARAEAAADAGAPGKPRQATTAGLARLVETMRIAKAMARAGLCSRRDAERWIEDGRVSVNGQRIRSPALDVGPRDRVVVDGTPLPAAEPPRLWRYHKPRGLVTTHRDPEGRPTVFDLLPPDLPRVVSIGRLDFNTEGLLLLTNDGELARHLELPATGWLRRYRVRVWGRVRQSDLDQLANGIEVDGVRYAPIDARIDETPEDQTASGRNSWLSIGLREGKNREVRNILGALGLEVGRLIRVSYGPFQLADLEPGRVEHVRRRVLGEQLGREIAAGFGLIGDEPDDVPPQRGR